MKTGRTKVEAIPSKRLYQSIIADYDTEISLCELIDNATDIWVKGGKAAPLKIVVELDLVQQVIRVSDNAGGVREADIIKIIAPGHTSNSGTADETIGVFGVGSKRAVVALAQQIRILTRYGNDKTLSIEYDDAWLQEETWDMVYHTETKDIAPGSTVIELSKLRTGITDSDVVELREHFAATYARFLGKKNLVIEVNGAPILPLNFDSSWSFPPHYQPQRVTFKLPIENDNDITVTLTAGLVSKDQVGEGEYGVYCYCNDRMILRRDKSYDFGFVSGQAGQPHPQLNPLRVIVSLNGSPSIMPWNSSKSGINFKNKVIQRLRPKIIQLVTYYAKLARKFVGSLDENVYQYNTGSIEEITLGSVEEPIKLYALPPPERRRNFAHEVIELNRALSNKKPWVIGLYEGIVLVNNLGNTNLVQQNRFSLIILDSTLEIAFKEFLIHLNGASRIGGGKLTNILQNRKDVEREVKLRVRSITATEWGLVSHYYLMRNNLIHQLATSDVKIEDIEKYRGVVESILRKMFRIQFPSGI